MNFKRDFDMCECGHERREHSANYPQSKCYANAECPCVQFSRLTKRAMELVRNEKEILSNDNQESKESKSK